MVSCRHNETGGCPILAPLRKGGRDKTCSESGSYGSYQGAASAVSLYADKDPVSIREGRISVAGLRWHRATS